jgi:DNA-binding NtrC family response regulator
MIGGAQAEQLLPGAAGQNRTAVPTRDPAPSPAKPAPETSQPDSAAAPALSGVEGPSRSPGVDKPFRDQVQDAEREIILHALAFTRDNVTEAAKLLDLERGHFYKKMKALGLRRGVDKDGDKGTQ